MIKENDQKLNIRDCRRGIALAITLMVLVVLSVLVATLAVRVSQVRQRQQYMMDYQKARYGLDSAMKYALTILPEKKFTLIDRKDAPDFSDLFWLSREDYLRYMDAWAAGTETDIIKSYLKKSQDEDSGVLKKEDSQSVFGQLLSKYKGDDLDNEPNDPNTGVDDFMEYFDPNQVVVPGPYGPAWPNVIEPVKLEIGECQVTIAIEDENAKMPLSWLVTNNMTTNKQAKAALQTFAEWMDISEDTATELVKQLEELSKKKMFKLSYSTVVLPVEKTTPADPAPQPQPTSRSLTRRRRTLPANPTQPQPQPQVQQKARAEVAHAADFAKLFHSSLLNIEPLAVLQKDRAFENESAMKYMALWGSQRININTAPRQVLQAAFTFGGNPDEIADAVILARKEKPIKTIAQLKSALPSYSSSVDRAAPYIDMESKFFSVRVTSRCGRAKVSSVAAVIKEDKKMEHLIMLYGR
jgi:hypothetical protein